VDVTTPVAPEAPGVGQRPDRGGGFAVRTGVVQTRRVRWFLTDKGMPTAGLIIAAVMLAIGVVLFAATTPLNGSHAGGLALIIMGGFGVVLCGFILIDLARRH
jgi:hypothetical protein